MLKSLKKIKNPTQMYLFFKYSAIPKNGENHPPLN